MLFMIRPKKNSWLIPRDVEISYTTLGHYQEIRRVLNWSATTCRRFGRCDLSQQAFQEAPSTKRGGDPPRAKAVTGHRTPNQDSTKKSAANALVLA
jgi:hypothetical protein